MKIICDVKSEEEPDGGIETREAFAILRADVEVTRRGVANRLVRYM